MAAGRRLRNVLAKLAFEAVILCLAIWKTGMVILNVILSRDHEHSKEIKKHTGRANDLEAY